MPNSYARWPDSHTFWWHCPIKRHLMINFGVSLAWGENCLFRRGSEEVHLVFGPIRYIDPWYISHGFSLYTVLVSVQCRYGTHLPVEQQTIPDLRMIVPIRKTLFKRCYHHRERLNELLRGTVRRNQHRSPQESTTQKSAPAGEVVSFLLWIHSIGRYAYMR
jgi:hypothetical protein